MNKTQVTLGILLSILGILALRLAPKYKQPMWYVAALVSFIIAIRMAFFPLY